MAVRIRRAVKAEVPALLELIDASVRGLQTREYTMAQIDSALRHHYGVDSRLIEDGTYFVAEEDGRIVAAGGWSRRQTLSGGDQAEGRADELLDPARDAARIRAFFVHPAWARRGLGSAILERCEQEARAAGFTRLEMIATLTGVAFYRARGYREAERFELALGDGTSMPVVRMIGFGGLTPAAS